MRWPIRRGAARGRNRRGGQGTAKGSDTLAFDDSPRPPRGAALRPAPLPSRLPSTKRRLVPIRWSSRPPRQPPRDLLVAGTASAAAIDRANAGIQQMIRRLQGPTTNPSVRAERDAERLDGTPGWAGRHQCHGGTLATSRTGRRRVRD